MNGALPPFLLHRNTAVLRATKSFPKNLFCKECVSSKEIHILINETVEISFEIEDRRTQDAGGSGYCRNLIRS